MRCICVGRFRVVRHTEFEVGLLFHRCREKRRHVYEKRRITAGEKDGPTSWVTATLHGNEVTGIAAAQDFVSDDIVEQLRGTVVCVPILDPAGIRLDQRNSYYRDEDPNRYFPYDVGPGTSPPSVQELIDGRIFDRFSETADALVSLHEGWINEALYIIVERP